MLSLFVLTYKKRVLVTADEPFKKFHPSSLLGLIIQSHFIWLANGVVSPADNRAMVMDEIERLFGQVVNSLGVIR